jgi:hypothetical protein
MPVLTAYTGGTSIDPAITGELSEERLGPFVDPRQVEPSGAGPSQPQ